MRSQIVISNKPYHMTKSTKSVMIPDELLMNKIYLIREQKIMLDKDLSELYGVETKVLTRQLKETL